MAATIATLIQKTDGTYEGVLKTLTVSAPIVILPNQKRNAGSQEPDYRILARKNGYELGAGWLRISKATGEEYLSCAFSAPEFGTIYGNMADSPTGTENEKVVIWNAPGN